MKAMTEENVQQQQQQQPDAAPTTAEPTETAPQDTAPPRQEVYEQHYGGATQGGEEPAQATPPEASPPQQSDDLRKELQELRELVAKAVQQQQPQPPEDNAYMPAEAGPPRKPGESDEDYAKRWIEFYQEGKYEEGAKALADLIDREQASTWEERQRQIMAQTVELLEARNEMQRAAAEVARQHPELKPMQPYIEAAIERDLVMAKQRGEVKSYGDYAKVYKDSLKRHVDRAIQFTQSIRAAGSQEARVRSEEVVSQTVIRPDQVTGFGEQTQETPKETPKDPLQEYLRQRREAQLKRDGLLPPGATKVAR